MAKPRIGILTPQMSRDYGQIMKIWREAESYGFDSAWLVDHLIPYDYPTRPKTEPMLECWMTLSALAAATRSIRLGPLVTCNSYRQPQLLAKMSSSLDVISEGRLNFGIGAGWLKEDFEEYGYMFSTAPERMARLEEAITIIKLMWAEEEATFAGKYYAVDKATNYPKPQQKPHPPVYVGGDHPNAIRLVARHADVWNFPSDINAYTPNQYQIRVRTLEQECDKIGRDPKTIRRSWLGIGVTGGDQAEVDKRCEPINTLTKDKLSNEIVGTPDICAQKMGEYEDLGVSEFILIFPENREIENMYEFSTIVKDRL